MRNLPGDSSFTDPVEGNLEHEADDVADDKANVENAVGMVTLTDVLEIMVGGKIISESHHASSEFAASISKSLKYSSIPQEVN